MQVDWFQVITDLKRRGMNQEQVAREVRVTRKTVWNWANQVSEPPYSKGATLLSVYRAVMGSTG